MNNINEFIGINDPPPTRIDVCDKHGDFTSSNYMKTIWSKCPTCSEEKRQEGAKVEEYMANEKKELAWANRLKQSGIPERFNDRSLSNFITETKEQERALKFAQSYANGFDEVMVHGRSAILSGKPGTGKTHLAVAIGLHVLRTSNRTVLFTTVVRAIRRVKETWSKGRSESETSAIEALTSPDLLILDEVGVQFGSDTEKLIMFDVINERYEERKPTILLSNLMLDEVKTYLGERIFDRLREDGGKYIPFEWQSWRGRVDKIHMPVAAQIKLQGDLH